MIPNQSGGNAGPFAEPAQGHLLQLGGGRRASPEHAVDVQGGGQHLPEDSRLGAGVGEVGHEAGVVPVGDGGHDEAVEIGQDGLHGLACFGAVGRQRVGELAGLDGRKHGIALGVSEIIGDPIDRLIAVAAEFVGSHGRMNGQIPVSVRTGFGCYIRERVCLPLPNPASRNQTGPLFDAETPRKPYRSGVGVLFGVQPRSHGDGEGAAPAAP